MNGRVCWCENIKCPTVAKLCVEGCEECVSGRAVPPAGGSPQLVVGKIWGLENLENRNCKVVAHWALKNL